MEENLTIITVTNYGNQQITFSMPIETRIEMFKTFDEETELSYLEIRAEGKIDMEVEETNTIEEESTE